MIENLPQVLAALSSPESAARNIALLFDSLAHLDCFKKYLEKDQKQVVVNILRNLEVEHFEDYRPVFFKGDKATKFYIIARGRVSILLPAKNHKQAPGPSEGFAARHGGDPRLFDVKTGEFTQHAVAELGCGAVFGELGLLNGKPRLATAVADPAAVLLSLNQETFRLILKPLLQTKIDSKNRFLKCLLEDYCNYEDVWRFAAYFEPLELEKGKVVVREGEAFSKVFVIADGSVELRKRLRLPDEAASAFVRRPHHSLVTTIVVYGKEQFFGIKELFDELHEFFFEARTLEPSLLYTISVDNLRKCLGDFASFSKFFSNRCRFQADDLNYIYSRTATLKLCAYNHLSFNKVLDPRRKPPATSKTAPALRFALELAAQRPAPPRQSPAEASTRQLRRRVKVEHSHSSPQFDVVAREQNETSKSFIISPIGRALQLGEKSGHFSDQRLGQHVKIYRNLFTIAKAQNASQGYFQLKSLPKFGSHRRNHKPLTLAGKLLEIN